MPSNSSKPKPKVAIVSNFRMPGGAMKLMINCASVLADNGYDVSIYTPHFDPDTFYEETKSGKYAIVETGRFLPICFLGRFVDFFAHLKSFVLTIKALLGGFDILICDGNPLPIKVGKVLRPDLKYLFYCHYPEYQMPGRKSLIMKCYRFFFDYVEEKGLATADKVFVNSKFTLQAFKLSFPSIEVEPEVLYPTTFLHTNGNSKTDSLCDKDKEDRDKVKKYLEANSEIKIITSINRFDPMKNLLLAIETLLELHKNPQFKGRVKLLFAGSYYAYIKINVECINELKSFALSSGFKTSEWPDLEGDVVFMRSFNESMKPFIFEISKCVLYPSVDEHFGIVPLEAALAKLPVIGTNSGGLKETIVHEQTGFLCEPNAVAFSEAAAQILSSPEKQRLLGENAYKSVVENFSFQTFEKQLVGVVNEFHKKAVEDSRKRKHRCSRFYLLGFLSMFLIFTIFSYAIR